MFSVCSRDRSLTYFNIYNCRFRQQIVQNAQASPLFTQQQAADAQYPSSAEASPSQPPAANYLRLPVESAKKLRWYDQHDVKMLIQIHLREKHELHQANSMLREALKRLGSSRPEMAEVNAAIDKLKAEDDAVNDVLVLAAQAEIESLQDQVADLSAQLRSAQQRLIIPEAVTPVKAERPVAMETDAMVETPEQSEQGDNFIDHGPQQAGMCFHCIALQQQTTRLSSAVADAAVARELAEEQLVKTRQKFSEMQQAQLEVVKLSQDERLQAEARCEEAETRASKAVERAEQLSGQVKRLQERSLKFENDLQAERAKNSSKADANAAQQRAKTSELSVANASLSQQLASSQAQVTALEHRLAAAESEAVRAVADARDLEASAAERDDLSARLAAAEARLEETRASHLSSSSLRDMMEQSESKRLAAEEELVATAKLAAELEERLVKATVAAESALLEAQQAEIKAAAAWEAIDAAVEQRWGEAGENTDLWPDRARDVLDAVEARLAALTSAHKSLQEKMAAAETAQKAAEQRSSAAEHKAKSAEANMQRLSRSAEQKERHLETAALSAARQVDEFRAALGRLERERDQLLDEKKGWEGDSRLGVKGSKYKSGGGSISDGLEVPPTPADHYLIPTPRPGKDGIDATDMVYLKNVLLKFLRAHMENKVQECEVLLPALAAVLRASPSEFSQLRELHKQAHASFGGWL